MDDKELLRRLKAEDREAQKTFWELHRDPVYRFIFSRSRLKKASAEEFEIRKVDDSDAQDILVSTFVSFFKDINKFRGENATMKTWLYGIAKNRIIDFYRQEDRQHFEDSTPLPSHNGREPEEDLTTPSLEMREASRPAGQILFKTRLHAKEIARSWQSDTSSNHEQEDSIQIQEALGKLPHEQRRVVTLRFLQGHSIKETADILKISEGAVKMAALRGIKKMSDFLKDQTANVEGAPLS